MTREDAINQVKDYRDVLLGLTGLMAIAGIDFCRSGSEIEKALGVPEGTLAKALNDAVWITVVSNYITVLENAAKGQLTPVVEEWEELLSE
jgi:hypothetical protein